MAQQRFITMIGAGYGTAAGALFFNAQPAIVGVLAETFGFAADELGSIVGLVLGCIFFVLVSSYYWVHRVGWPGATALGAILATLGSVGILYADSFWGVSASLSLVGGGAAIVYAICLASLAQTEDPTRAFGFAITLQVGLAAVAVYALPGYLTPNYGLAGLAGFMALVNALSLGVAFFVGKQESVEKEVHASPSTGDATKRLVTLCLVAMAVYFVGLNGVWAFIERIGASTLPSAEAIGLALSAALIVGAAGAIAASIVGRRIDIIKSSWITGLAFVIFVLIMLVWANAIAFTIALIVFTAAWNFSLPYQMDLIAQLDAQNRFIVLLPAAQMVGGALGPVLAGMILVSSGAVGVYVQMLVCTVIAFGLYVFIAMRRSSEGSSV